LPAPLFVIAALSAAFSSMASVVDAQSPTRDIAIVGAAVIDVAAGKATPGQTIIVRGSRIVAMGTRATTTVPGGALVVDAAGKFLMPGLWDMPGHIFPRATTPADERAWQLPLYVATGVTGVRDMWTNLEDFAQLRAWNEGSAAGRLIAPRIVPTGPMFDGPTGTFRTTAIVVADSADARRAVDSIARGGAHAVKMHNAIPRDAFFALAAHAKQHGLPLIGHVPAHVTVREALAAGQSDIEHYGAADGCDTEAAEAEAMRMRAGPGQRPAPGAIQQLLLDNYDGARCDDLMKELVRRGIWVTPTLVVAKYMLIPDDSTITTRDELRFVPAAERAEWSARRDSTPRRRMAPALAATRRNVFRAQETLVATMQRAGVSLMIGTDMANDWLVPGFSVHDELASFVEAGVSPADALRAATLTPATYLRATDSLGTVAVGHVADLVLLDADPLADIRNTRRIRAVFTRGRYFDRAALDTVLSTAERRNGAVRRPAGKVDRIQINDNRAPAGTLRAGVLTIHLEARDGIWHPDADSGLGVTVRAFAADGGPLEIPGPLVRVPLGTEIHASITNATTGRGPLVLHGLNTRVSGGASADAISIGVGETRAVRFIASRIGTFYYWASSNGVPAIGTPRGIDSQLSGALVVDPADGRSSRDRIFVIAGWNQRVGPDSVPASGFVINGKSWPNTERLTYHIGDSVRFRVLNLGPAVHPMHLHGFYYNVDSRGDEQSDTMFAATSSPHLVNTERLASGRTFTLTWIPTRDGNWLFHCHEPAHIAAGRGLDGSLPIPDADLAHDHVTEMMSGPVMGISVLASRGRAASAPPRRSRQLRLVAQVDSGSSRLQPSFGYALDMRDGRPTQPSRPGPILVLQRGEPVSITIVNQLPEPTSVHWHGIELESYYDGVAGFAGHAGHLAPEIAPNDSFVARFTPPRSGTFMYHPHVGEVRQQTAGLDGVLLVVDSLRGYHPDDEIVLLVTAPSASTANDGDVFLNGSATPKLRDLRAGKQYRVRLLHLHNSRPGLIVTLTQDATTLVWRAIAKDGMTLPSDQATLRPAIQQIANGETYDFELKPLAPGELRLTITAGKRQVLLSTSVSVK